MTPPMQEANFIATPLCNYTAWLAIKLLLFHTCFCKEVCHGEFDDVKNYTTFAFLFNCPSSTAETLGSTLTFHD